MSRTASTNDKTGKASFSEAHSCQIINPGEGRVYLQDLCREEAVEVTDLVAKSRDRIVLDYDALAQNGWLKNDEGDCSAPGFMIWQE